MTDSVSNSTVEVVLTDDVTQHPAVFEKAFNSGDPDSVEQVYEPLGILVDSPGHVVVGADRRAANAKLQALGVPIRVSPRHVFVNDDIALMIVDWQITGTTRDGANIDVRGTATDVARRGTDGKWRYTIDNPFGVSELSLSK